MRALVRHRQLDARRRSSDTALGPEVNSVEALGKLVRAGVNVGTLGTLGCLVCVRIWSADGLLSPHELLTWFVRVPPERH